MNGFRKKILVAKRVSCSDLRSGCHSRLGVLEPSMVWKEMNGQPLGPLAVMSLVSGTE